MPAYPFGGLISLGEFCTRLQKDFDCTVETIPGPIGGQMRVITRTKGVSYPRRAVFDLSGKHGDNEILLPSKLRSMCTLLDIDPKIFGLELD